MKGAAPRPRPDRPATSHDVALAAGVSQPTVSRALRGDPRVAPATRERVAAAAAELGYVLSERGRSLSTRRTQRVGVVVDDLGNPFYLQLLDTLHDDLERSGQRMLVFTPHRNDPERVERLVDGSIDGVVLSTTLLGSSLPGQLRDRGFPFVLLNREVDGVEADICVTDNVGGAAQVAAELVRLGHERIGAILGPEATSTSRDRELGFRRVLDARGVALREEMFRRGPFSFATGHAGLTELLRASPAPTAVFCANDVIAFGALNAARGMGVDVPGDVTIVGFDDIAMAAWEVFRLTTVRQDLRRMSRIATGLLLARIAEPDRPAERVVLPAELVVRATHGPPPGT